jgi:hypothetical protein
MNLFILDENAVQAAQLQCDKHVSKMTVESGQMLSTIHRMLDGTLEKRPSKSGKTTVKYWSLSDARESVLYKAVHMSHPCTVWTGLSRENYMWHFDHFVALAEEYTHRYNKQHKTYTDLVNYLRDPPRNIPDGPLTLWPLAMKSNPECMFPNDPVKSYRLFYQTKQKRFKMAWTKREIPEWFEVMNG